MTTTSRPILRHNLTIKAGDELGMTSSCLNCTYFNEPIELCMKAKPPVRPPAKIIAFGCVQYLDCDEIPY